MTDSHGSQENHGECPLVNMNPFGFIGDSIAYCPFCGSEASGTDAGVGHAECGACGKGFWVEL